jgi:hypothetical protein
MMQHLGVALDIIDRCQNYVLAGSKVRRHYMHHDYADEKKVAWAALGQKSQEVICRIEISCETHTIAYPQTRVLAMLSPCLEV